MPPPRLPPVGRNLVNQRSGVSGSNSDNNVPAQIKCYICKKVKPKSMYANRQLQRVQDSIHNPYAPGGRTKADPKPTCRSCTPQQTTQLTCCVCSKTKGLDSFARNQRKNPDTARCLKCVAMHIETEADYEIPDSDIESDSDEDFDFDDPTQTKLKSNHHGVPTFKPENTKPRAPLYDDDDDDDGHWELAGKHASGSQSSAPSTKKGGWGKVPKIPSGQETPWGDRPSASTEVDNHDSNAWIKYGHRLEVQRYGAPVKSTSKHKVRMQTGQTKQTGQDPHAGSQDEDGDDWD